MALLGRPVIMCGLLLLAVGRLWAASPTENLAFEAAAEKFQDEWYGEAENSFGEFAKTFPTSPRLPEAIFYQAVARVKLTNYAGAVDLLSSHKEQAGKWADEYAFWQAEALFQKGDYPAAAAGFEKFLHDFPSSPRRFEAALRDASTRAKLADWPGVITLLEQTNGVFQATARTNSTGDLVPLGYLLLSQALLAQGACGAAENALRPFLAGKLEPAIRWQGQHLLCRILVENGRLEAALTNSSVLAALAQASAQRDLQAETAAFQADLFERLGWADQAEAAYRENLAGGVPAERQRQALLGITKLALTQGDLAEAADLLETFLLQQPQAESADLAQLTVGELRLRQYEPGLETNLVATPDTNAPAATNDLHRATIAFQTLIQKFPRSPFFGKAQLGLGWCYWLWPADKLPESKAAFQTAVQRLPFSSDQATACFKLADVEFRLANYDGAISNYSAVINKFGGFPQVRSNLFAPALYQIVRAALANGSLAAATNALGQLQAGFADRAETGRALLLTAQELRRADAPRALRLLLDFAQAAPKTELLPELDLAIAATYEEENKFQEAIQRYDHFLANYANNPAQPRAEFARALASFWAGQYTNAMTQFTNFIVRYPTNEFAPQAQMWAADYYYRIGEVAKAEMGYQQIFQNSKWPVSELTYQARMMAGRAATDQLLWKNATNYLFQVAQAQDTVCPLELRQQAYFALANVFVKQGSTNRHADLSDAIAALRQAAALCPTNRLAVLALGEEANCQLEWPDYDRASNAYQQVASSPLADIAARSMAKVGLGVTLEQLGRQKAGGEQAALFEEALHQWLDVFYCDPPLLHEGEKPDPFWTKKAGLEAARLAEDLKRRTQAIHVYERLQSLFPTLRFDERINALKLQDANGAPNG